MHHAREPHRGAALRLGWVFLRIGVMAFAGLGTTETLIEREFMQQRRMLTAADLAEALMYTQILRSATVMPVVSYLGYKLGGWSGSALAIVAFLCPAALAMLFLAAVYMAVTTLPAIGMVVDGLTAAIASVLLVIVYRLGTANIKESLMLGMVPATYIAGAFLGVKAALIMVVAGLIGLPLFVPLATGLARQTRAAHECRVARMLQGHQ